MSLIDIYARDSITIVGKGSLGGDGTWAYDGTSTSTTARVVEQSGTRLRDTGYTYAYKYIVYLKPGETVALEDRITFGGVNYRVMDIMKGDFLDGVHSHKKVWIA